MDPVDEKNEVKTESEKIEVVIEDEPLEVSTESVQPEVATEAFQTENVTEPKQTMTVEETIKEFTSRELKEIVKNLNSIEKSKFITPAKNGKNEEAIEICKEVTGLDQKNAEKIINLKLYY